MAIPPPPPATPPPPPPPPAKGGNRTLIIVLCIIGGILVLIGGCVATCTYVVSKKAKQYTREAQKNPQLAAISLAASLHPDIQIVSKDEAAGKITLRNKKTGEVVTLDTHDLSSGNMSRAMEQFAKGMKPPAGSARTVAREPESAPSAAEPPPEEKPAEARISPARAAAQAAVMKKFPRFIPAYRGGKTLEASLQTIMGNTIGNYVFATDDPGEAVADFYEKALTDAGFTIAGRNNGTNDNGATISMIAQHTDPQMMTMVTIEIDKGQTHVDINFTRAGAR